MFTIEFDTRQKVVRVIFSLSFTVDDLAGLDDVAEVLVAAEGPMSAIFDCTLIDSIGIPAQRVASRGRLRQLCPGLRRAIVAPQPEMFSLAELFARSQDAAGSEAPQVVRTMAEALAWLGLDKLQSRPVEIGWMLEQIRQRS